MQTTYQHLGLFVLVMSGKILCRPDSGRQSGKGDDPFADMTITMLSKDWETGTIKNRRVQMKITLQQTQYKNWTSAREECNSYGGHILYWDEPHILVKTQKMSAEVGIETYILNTLLGGDLAPPMFWTGVHINGNRQLQKNYFGMPILVKEPRPKGGWDWADGWPWPDDGTPLCGAITPSMQTSYLELKDCTEKLAFICYRDVSNLVEDPACEDGWVSNELIDSCFKVESAVLTFSDATEACQDQGAELVHSYNFYYTAGNTVFWTNNPNSSCDTVMPDGTTRTVNCDGTYPFICETPIYRPAQTIKISTPTKYQTITVDGSFQTVENITCKMKTNSNLSSSNIVWFKDGQLLDPKKVYHDNPDVLRIIPNIGEFRNFYHGQVLKSTALTPDGVYWCEVWSTRPYKRIRSPTYRIKVSDVHVFVGSVSMKTGFDGADFLNYNYIRDVTDKVEEMDILVWSAFQATYIQLQKYLKFRIVDIPVNYEILRFRESSGRTIDVRFHVDLRNSEYDIMPKNLLSWLKVILKEVILTERSRRAMLPEFEPGSLELRSSEFCARSTVSIPNNMSLHFPPVLGGETVFSLESCDADGNIPLATMTCSGSYRSGYKLDLLDLQSECSELIDVTSEVTAALQDIGQRPIFENNVQSVLETVSNLTGTPDILRALDVVEVGDIVETASSLYTIPQKAVVGFTDIVNNMLQTSEQHIRIAQAREKSANKIIKSVEGFLENVDAQMGDDIQEVRPHIAMKMMKFDNEADMLIGAAAMSDSYELTNDTVMGLKNGSQMVLSNINCGLMLPAGMIRDEMADTGSAKITYAIFQDSRLFQAAEKGTQGIKTNGSLNSMVISATINGKKIQGMTENVRTMFLPFNETDVENNTMCAYWDFEMANGEGGWSDKGCSYEGLTDGRLLCSCDHLTYFAVLLDYYGQDQPPTEANRRALEIITIIGLSLSVIGLGITILTFIMFKRLRKGRSQKTMFCLAVSLFCGYIVFLAGIDKTGHNGGCIAVAVLLHYFLLTSFMWMLMEAVLQYLRFVKVLGTYIPKYMLKTSIPACGVPLIPIIIVLAIDYNLYRGGSEYCWMSLPVFYYSFAVPVAAIIVVNFVLYFIITIKLCFYRNDGLRSSQSKRTANILRIQASVACLLLMGLTWVFGFFAIEDARIGFQYIFTILNSLQGFFIFLMFTLRDKLVRQQWKKLLCPCWYKEEKGKKYSTSSTNKSSYNGSSKSGSTSYTSSVYDNKACDNSEA